MKKGKKTLAILGANGLLGGDLAEYLSNTFDVVPLTRENYGRQKGKKFDILINANGNSRRFWALQHIFEDFELSTVSVYKSLFDFKFEKYIYISSVDVYTKLGRVAGTSEDDEIELKNLNAYGLHKYLSEQIIRNTLDDYIILRSSLILGANPKKGPFFDIISGQPLFLTPDSRLQVITTLAISEIIDILIATGVRSDTFNTGGQGVIKFDDIEKNFKVIARWSKEAVRQCYEMDVKKLGERYRLRTSEAYLKDWMYAQKEI